MPIPPQHPLTIKKRDGRLVAFDRSKIVAAIMRAAQSVQGSDYRLAEDLADQVITALDRTRDTPETVSEVEQIQDGIEKVLIENGHARTAKAFILYRAERSRVREKKSEMMEWLSDALQAKERTSGINAPTKHHAVGRALTAQFNLQRLLPKFERDAHQNGDWHIHGLGDFGQTPHSGYVPLGEIFREGLRTTGGILPPPNSVADLAAVTTASILGALPEVHGALCIPNFDAIWALHLPSNVSEGELEQGIITLVHHLNLLMSRQIEGQPRTTFHVGLETSTFGRTITRALLQQLKQLQESGRPTPHLVFQLQEGVNLKPQDPNFSLFQEALDVAHPQGGIDFLHFQNPLAVFGDQVCLPCPPAHSRGVALGARITINLPRLALRAKRQGFETTELLCTLLDGAARHLEERNKRLSHRGPETFPFLYAAQSPPTGAAWNTAPVAINLMGLAEALRVLSGQDHGASPSAQAEGINLIKVAGSRVADLNSTHKINIILQGTPADEAGQRFAQQDRREFGIIRGITDKKTYTTGIGLPHDSEADHAREEAYQKYLGGGLSHVISDIWPSSPLSLQTKIEVAIASGIHWIKVPAKVE